jgi:hypothetical protein
MSPRPSCGCSSNLGHGKALTTPGIHCPQCAQIVWQVGRVLIIEYIQAEQPKDPPPKAVRVCRRSQLLAALRQNNRPIIIEDPELARPFTRLLRVRKMRLVGGLVTDAMAYALRQYYGTDIEERWCIGGYVLPGNAQRVILKPKANLVDFADDPAERDTLLLLGTWRRL